MPGPISRTSPVRSTTARRVPAGPRNADLSSLDLLAVALLLTGPVVVAAMTQAPVPGGVPLRECDRSRPQGDSRGTTAAKHG